MPTVTGHHCGLDDAKYESMANGTDGSSKHHIDWIAVRVQYDMVDAPASRIIPSRMALTEAYMLSTDRNKISGRKEEIPTWHRIVCAQLWYSFY